MPKPNDRNCRPPKVAERDISKTCIDYLKLRGWHCERQNAGPFGKGGVADYICLHYRRRTSIWVEFKSPGDKRTCRCATKQRGKCTVCLQADFAALVRGMGGTLLRVADVDAFIAYYEQRFGVEGQLRLGAE